MLVLISLGGEVMIVFLTALFIALAFDFTPLGGIIVGGAALGVNCAWVAGVKNQTLGNCAWSVAVGAVVVFGCFWILVWYLLVCQLLERKSRKAAAATDPALMGVVVAPAIAAPATAITPAPTVPRAAIMPAPAQPASIVPGNPSEPDLWRPSHP